MYWKMYADYRKEHIITTGMCTPRLAEIAHCEIRNLQTQDAEDICQDVFMKLLAKDYQFADPSAEKAWIIRTTINACKDHLRTSFWKRVAVLDEDYDIPAPKEPESDLLPLVMELPKNYRISIYLHYYEGYQVKEIASILRKPENTVSAYLARGRKKLKSVLESRSEYPYAATQGGTHYAK